MNKRQDNTYLVGTVQFEWSNFDEEKISEEANRAHKREKDQLRSEKRSLRKEIRKCKATIKELSRKLLRSQAMNDNAQKELLQQEVAQMYEQLNRNQQEQIKLQQQMVDQIPKLVANQVEAMKKEKEGKRFVFSLGGKHKRVLERVWTGMEQSQMAQLMKRLYQKFRIKLRQIAVHCGMQFVLDVPTENAEALEEQQAAIQETILEEIVPGDFQAEMEWEAPVPLAGECEQNPPVQVSEVLNEAPVEVGGSIDQQIVPAREPLRIFDPMTAVPRRSRAFQMPLKNPGMATESEHCRVTSLIITKSRLLVFAVFRMMKVTSIPMDSSSDHAGASLCLNVRPWDLAIFVNDTIAVASNTDVILLLEVGRDTIREVKEVETERRYTGVTSFGDGDILVVSSTEDSRGPAVIDVITEEGNVLWTVADRTTIPALRTPLFLHMQHHNVLVSDKNGPIHRVDINSRTPHSALSHPDLNNPGQVTTDHEGQNVFVCSCQNKCVLVYSMTSGQWRTLLTGAEHGERGKDTPQAVGVTEDGLVVVAWEKDMAQSDVVVYDLKP